MHAWELKCAGLDWRRGILSRCLNGVALAVVALKADPAFTSEAQRVRAFIASGAGCRATYFNHAKKLQAVQRPAWIVLAHTTPPAEAIVDPNYLDGLRHRFGELGNG